jgi:two-component system, sensor histidine kinase and response regulator
MITIHHPASPASISATQRRTLLVVDDESANRALLERLFKRDFDVISAQDGCEALDILSQRPFDLVLLDIMMPQVSGLEVLRQIRETPEIADLPVILVSALSDNDAIIRGLKLGANDYVTKPLEIDVLRARVETQSMLKRLLDERKDHIRRLEEAQAFKDHCFQMASHDLKGPLGNLRMAHTLVRDDLSEDSKGRIFLDLADGAVDTMQRVIEEFLDLAVLQSGKLKINLSQVSVDAVVDRLADQYRLTALQKNIEININMSYLLVQADEMLFTQSLSNLVSNAIKYSPFQSRVSVWAEQRGDVVRINVADQGPGVPDSERDRLFTQFGKLKARPTNGESSTGLGLWIVKSHTEAQQGHVGVECPPEGGSIFWLEMPAS